MSRLQRIVLTVAALAIGAFSLMPPWLAVNSLRPDPHLFPNAQAERVLRPLGSYPLWAPPLARETSYRSIRVDYGRLGLYYVGTIALVVPFFVRRRRLPLGGGGT